MCTCTTEMSRRSSCSGENHLPPMAHVRQGTCRHVAVRSCGNETGRYIDAAAKRQRRAQRQSHSTFLTVGLSAVRPSTACLFFLPFGEYNTLPQNLSLIPSITPGPSFPKNCNLFPSDEPKAIHIII